MPPRTICCVNGCQRWSRCYVCIRCTDHCICSDASTWLPRYSGYRGLILAMFGREEGIKPRPPNARREPSLELYIEKEQILMNTGGQTQRLARTSEIRMDHYVMRRSGDARSVLGVKEAAFLKALSANLSKERISMVSTARRIRASRSAGLELICDSALLVTRECLEVLDRQLFDYLELSEVDSLVVTNGMAQSELCDDDWCIIFPKLVIDGEEREFYQFYPSMAWQRGCIGEPRETVAALGELVHYYDAGFVHEVGVITEDSGWLTQGGIIDLTPHLAHEPIMQIVNWRFGLVLGAKRIGQGVERNTPETHKLRSVWEIHPNRRTEVASRLHISLRLMSRGMPVNLNSLAEQARMNVKDALCYLNSAWSTVALSPDTGCYLPDCTHRDPAGLVLTSLALKDVIGASVTLESGRLLSRSGMPLVLQGSHIRQIEEEDVGTALAAPDLDRLVNGVTIEEKQSERFSSLREVVEIESNRSHSTHGNCVLGKNRAA